MSADVLELVFTGFAVIGTGLLLLSSIGGGMHVRLHIPMQLPHVHVPFVHWSNADNATAMPMMLGFVAMFGIGGLFGAVAFGFGPIGRTLVALLFGMCGAAVAFRDIRRAAACRRAGADRAARSGRPSRARHRQHWRTRARHGRIDV